VLKERTASRLVVLAAVAVVGWGLAIVAIVGRSRSTPGIRASPIRSQITYVDTGRRRLSPGASALVLHHVVFEAASKPITIRWYDSDFEPVQQMQAALVGLYVDGTRVASTIKASLTGTYEDGPGYLVWRGTLRVGRHEIEVRLVSRASWGMPYTDPNRLATDSLTIDPGDFGGT
jgi:hypothetical protein